MEVINLVDTTATQYGALDNGQVLSIHLQQASNGVWITKVLAAECGRPQTRFSYICAITSALWGTYQ